MSNFHLEPQKGDKVNGENHECSNWDDIYICVLSSQAPTELTAVDRNNKITFKAVEKW